MSTSTPTSMHGANEFGLCSAGVIAIRTCIGWSTDSPGVDESSMVAAGASWCIGGVSDIGTSIVLSSVSLVVSVCVVVRLMSCVCRAMGVWGRRVGRRLEE